MEKEASLGNNRQAKSRVAVLELERKCQRI